MEKKKSSRKAVVIAILVVVAVIIGLFLVKPCLFKGHNYTSEITVEATCVEEGVETFTCSVCGDQYNEPIEMTGEHQWETVKIIKRPTCGSKGEKKEKCSVCGEKRKKDIAKSGKHKYGTWVVTKSATTGHSGKKERTCSVCGDKDYKTIAKIKTSSSSSGSSGGPSHYKICAYMLDRYDYYDMINGGYAGDQYTDQVFRDAMNHFGISYDEVSDAWYDYDANLKATQDH